jgi:hypothetical protein
MMQNTPVDDPTYPAISFYPQYMQSILTTPSLARTRTYEPSPSPAPAQQLRAATLPLHAKRTAPKPTHAPHARPKPTGPRSRSNSCDWRRLEPLGPRGKPV